MIEKRKTKAETKVTLRKAVVSERRKIFEWLTNSDISPLMMGPPLFPDAPIPTWKEFVADYPDRFFQDTAGNIGRCFIILLGEDEVGTVGYDLLNRKKKWAGLDIWLKDDTVCGHGYGTEALMLLSEYLEESEGIRYFYIAPSLRNPRAIRAYKKAGFVQLKMNRKKAGKKFGIDVFDYKDTVVMRRVMAKKGGHHESAR